MKAYWTKVKTAGAIGTLYFHNGIHHCGGIYEGVCFAMDDSNGFVVPLEELERLVRIAKEYRRPLLLEFQVEDPDNDPEILAARRHVYWTTELAEKAMEEMANTTTVDVKQMEKIYSPDVLKLFYCEYCRKRVSRNHECEKGVR